MAKARVVDQEKKEAEKRNMEERRKKKREGVAIGGRLDFSVTHTSNTSGGSGTETPSTGGIDDLISAIKSGKAFSSDLPNGRKINTSNAANKEGRKGRG